MGIVAAPGSQVLIQQLPTLSLHRRVSIVGPTYLEHAKNWKERGHEVSIVNGLADIQGAEIVVIVNPNNPNGKTATCDDLLSIANKEIKSNGLLVIDEAFADARPEVSIIPHLTNDLIVVLRSFGKFFGLPGIRLGFAVGPPQQINLLKKKLGPWAVSGPAIEIGARAFNDTQWIKTTRTQLIERCKKLDAIFQRAGLKVLGGTDLFRLIENERAQMLFYHLGKLGIFVRRFPEHKSWLRLGVPNSKSDFTRLEEALTSALYSCR
jgi:cobalamin biosynthetic protein CobC